MRLSVMWGAPFALVVALWSGMAFAATDDKAAADDKGGTPKAVDLIFEHKHLSNVENGKEVDYNFNRTATDPALLGQPFSDKITLKVVAAKPTGEKDVDLQIYTGERARDLQKLPGLTINPVFIVYFDQAVSSFGNLAGGKLAYLRNAFSMALKDKTKVEPIKLDYNGKQIDAYRITMNPYVDDEHAAKMQGWEDAQYVIVLSDQVPGEIVDLVSIVQEQIQRQREAEARGADYPGWRDADWRAQNDKALTLLCPCCDPRVFGRGRCGSRLSRAAAQRLSHGRSRGLRVRLHANQRSDPARAGEVLVLHRSDRGAAAVR